MLVPLPGLLRRHPCHNVSIEDTDDGMVLMAVQAIEPGAELLVPTGYTQSEELLLRYFCLETCCIEL